MIYFCNKRIWILSFINIINFSIYTNKFMMNKFFPIWFLNIYRFNILDKRSMPFSFEKRIIIGRSWYFFYFDLVTLGWVELMEVSKSMIEEEVSRRVGKWFVETSFWQISWFCWIRGTWELKTIFKRSDSEGKSVIWNLQRIWESLTENPSKDSPFFLQRAYNLVHSLLES